MTEEFLNLHDYEAAASHRLEPLVLGYYASGACDEITLRENRAAFDRLSLAYRVLVDVSRRRLETTVLGQKVAFPVLVAPTAFQRLATPEGELATVRAAGGAGTIHILSTLSTTSIEEVLGAATGPVWFQLYVFKDRGVTETLIRRAESAGARALVLTVDAPVLGRRERDVRHRFKLPQGLRVQNLEPEGLGRLPEHVADSGLAAYFASLLDASLTWRDLEWLRARTRLPIVVKGLVRADDARRAADHGANAVVVSNHGGRQLDTSPATIEVLESVVQALAGRAEVLLDGGVRRGTDVVKALALGARAVLLGRPILWGLAVAGEAGAAHVLALLRAEVDLAFALCGCPTVADVTRDLVVARAGSA